MENNWIGLIVGVLLIILLVVLIAQFV